MNNTLPKQKERKNTHTVNSMVKLQTKYYLNEMSEYIQSDEQNEKRNHMKSFCVYWSNG